MSDELHADYDYLLREAAKLFPRSVIAVTYPDDEIIAITVDLDDYVFEIGSDDDAYIFFCEDRSSSIPLMPE